MTLKSKILNGFNFTFITLILGCTLDYKLFTVVNTNYQLFLEPEWALSK